MLWIHFQFLLFLLYGTFATRLANRIYAYILYRICCQIHWIQTDVFVCQTTTTITTFYESVILNYVFVCFTSLLLLSSKITRTWYRSHKLYCYRCRWFFFLNSTPVVIPYYSIQPPLNHLLVIVEAPKNQIEKWKQNYNQYSTLYDRNMRTEEE